MSSLWSSEYERDERQKVPLVSMLCLPLGWSTDVKPTKIASQHNIHHELDHRTRKVVDCRVRDFCSFFIFILHAAFRSDCLSSRGQKDNRLGSNKFLERSSPCKPKGFLGNRHSSLGDLRKGPPCEAVHRKDTHSIPYHFDTI